MDSKRKFKFARKVTLANFAAGEPILSADYTFIDKDGDSGQQAIYQCDLVEEEDREIKFKMGSEIYKLDYENNQLVAQTIQTQEVGFLESSSAFEKLSSEIDAFFNNLPVYEELQIKHPKRGALVYSTPGCGKTAGLLRIANRYTGRGDTCVLIWPSDVVKADEMETFLGKHTDWSKVEKLILILEDIGGGADTYGVQHAKIPASLLNFLDGMNTAFLKPTFIVATSNNPDSLNSTLTSRPGRFDAVIEVKTPDSKNRVKFLKFFAGKYFTLNEEEEAQVAKLTDGFSIAHLKEVYVRSRLFNKSMIETAKEIKTHVKKVKEGLTSKTTSAVGFGDEVDPFD